MMRVTSYFAGAIGAASEMTLLSERENARTDLVAASHSLRLLIVTVTIPFALQFSGLHGLDILPPTLRVVNWSGLALMALLTGAGALLMDRLERAVATTQRDGRHGALLFLDLDNFKGINDTMGHEWGDRLLVQVAARIGASVRATDTVARRGGDEPVVVLHALLGRGVDLAAAQP
eukprot:gene2584-3651_t